MQVGVHVNFLPVSVDAVKIHFMRSTMRSIDAAVFHGIQDENAPKSKDDA